MEREIEELKQKQQEEKEILRKKHQKQLASINKRVKKKRAKENTIKRKSLTRLDIIMGALVRSAVSKEKYLQFISVLADERDCSFATERYKEWLSDGNNSSESYVLIKEIDRQPEFSGMQEKPQQSEGYTSQQ